MRPFTLPVLALAALAAGCAVGPDFEHPAAPDASLCNPKAPDKTVSADTSGGEEQVFACGEQIPAAWWTLYHSDGLDRLIKDAMAGNPDIEAAEAALREAEENIGAGEGLLLPTVSGTFSSEREKTTSASGGGHATGSVFTLHNASVSVSYGFDVFGLARRTIEELEAEEDFQQDQLRAAQIALTANVVTAAIGEASLRAQIAATQAMVADNERQIDLLRKKFDAGAVARSAILSQEQALEQQRASLPPLEQQLAATRHELSVLAGRTPDKEPEFVFTLDDLTLPAKIPVSLPAKLIEQRPDVRAADDALHAASAAIGVAIANRLPGIALTADIGAEANNIGKLFTPGSGLWDVGAAVSETIFDAGTLAHKQGAAEAEYDRVKAVYRKTVLAALEDVADSLHALKDDARALKSQTAAFRAAQGNLRLANTQYEAGAIDELTLLDAKQAAEQARLGFIEAKARRYADTAALFQALGGGWWNKDADGRTTDKIAHKAASRLAAKRETVTEEQ